MKDHIKIVDWAGNILYQGHYKKKEVDKVLDANRCDRCGKSDGCVYCDDTGYIGDFSIYWVDENRNDNVYEFIYY